MTMSDYIVFIISHGRPNDVVTLNTLRRRGYSGDYRIIVDNEDKTRADYQKKYGDKVVVFDKLAYANMVDESNNFNDRRTTTHVRNACFDIAADCGFVKFLVLDDDYTEFAWRTDEQQNYPKHVVSIKNISSVFSLMFEFLEKSGLDCVAMAQGGDFIGGGKSISSKFVNGRGARKIMNTFFCMTTRRFWFFSQMNEDVNTYLALGRTGAKFMSVPFVSINQKQTQSTQSGMTDVYLRYGTYVKSFYSVMYAPSCTRVAMLATVNSRIHHAIKWKNAVPQILPPNLKK
jgi:hypothetical protein